MIKINLTKAQEITHEVRRVKRSEAFKPLDVQATIPSMALDAEAKRQAIREADASIQIAIDQAKDDSVLKEIISNL